MRKVYWEILPKLGNDIDGTVVNWRESVGQKVRFVYDDTEGIVEIVSYNNNKLGIKYLNYDVYYIFTDGFRRCQFGRLIQKFKTNHIYKVGDVVNNLEILEQRYMITSGIKVRTYKYKCLKCGFDCGEHYKNGELIKEFNISEGGLKRGNSCAFCHPSSAIIITNINSMYKTDHWMVELGVDEEFAKKHSKSSNKKCEITCRDCGKVHVKKPCDVYSKKSIGCSCGDGFSYGHKYMISILEQLNNTYSGNYTPNWCKFYNIFKNKQTMGEYDFILEDFKLIVEVDGGWHRSDNKMSGQTKEESEFIDNEKDRLAIENGYNIIRVSDENDFKQNVLNSKLSNIFDLSDIDWIKCGEFAMSSLSRLARDIYNNDNSLSTGDIARTMGLHTCTVLDWLKKWAKLGLCNYDSKEAMRQNGINNRSAHKSVEVIKNNNIVGTFESLAELEKQSLGIFGTILRADSASKVCRNKADEYKNFTFRFVNN